MTITIIGWILIATGILMTALVLLNGYRNDIKGRRDELIHLESAGFASTYQTSPRKQSVYSGPMNRGATNKKNSHIISRSARELLREVEEDVEASEVAVRKDNTLDSVLEPLRERERNGIPDTPPARKTGTSILRDDEVKEIRATAGTDVLFQAAYSEPAEKPEARVQAKKVQTNDTDILGSGTDVLANGTDVLSSGTDVLQESNTDVLRRGGTEPLISYKERQLRCFKEQEEPLQECIEEPAPSAPDNATGILPEANGTGVLNSGTDILYEEGTGVLREGTDILSSGTDVLDRTDNDTAVLNESTEVLSGGTDILPEERSEGTGLLPETGKDAEDYIEAGLDAVVSSAKKKFAEEEIMRKLASLQSKVTSQPAGNSGTDVLAEGTGILKEGTALLQEGTDILPPGTGILPEEYK